MPKADLDTIRVFWTLGWPSDADGRRPDTFEVTPMASVEHLGQIHAYASVEGRMIEFVGRPGEVLRARGSIDEATARFVPNGARFQVMEWLRAHP